MKTIKNISVILIIAIITMAFATRENSAEFSDNYFCVYAYNLDTKKIIISNIFQCSEFEVAAGTLRTGTAADFLKSEYGFELESTLDVQILSNPGKNFVYENRNEKINDARDKNYTITKINIYCNEGLLFEKE
jgi:hypothetical protein